MTREGSASFENLKKHVWKPKGMFQVPDLRVADMLSTTIIGSEDMGTHDEYIIQVNCGDTISWEVIF